MNDDTTLTGGPPESGSPECIGPYRILQKIGEGGMGEVYEAEQEKPVRRKVALKLIKRGMDSKQVVARFEAERQALALMDHPAVAKVFDAGATERGRPYFVLEHVSGVPINEYCDRHKLSNRERLDLFTEVCEGVQHAHQKGVIHRDLKPSNVLVGAQNGKAVPKIIDFGVAKATAQKLTEKTLFTELGVLIGTPEYMSPEQAEMTSEDVDTRTDVYALGVMLYELLTGALPFNSKELRSGGLEGIRRKIREEQPPKPSARLSTLGDEKSRESAARRRVDLPMLRSQLQGDLDWIVMRALEKDRTRRYGSPSELAADVRRHLKDEPVLACPPSVTYQAGKFFRRHRFGVLTASAVLVLLIAFAATMVVQARRIASERDGAEQAKRDLESVVAFQSGMLSTMDTEGVGRRLMDDLKRRVVEAARGDGLSDVAAEVVERSFGDAVRRVNATDAARRMIDQEILARAIETLEEEYADQPLIDARLRGTIGCTYSSLGLYAAAEPQLQRALETNRRTLGDDHPQTLGSMGSLARLYLLMGRHVEAERLFFETLESQREVLGRDHPDSLASMSGLAEAYLRQDRHDDAEPLYLETIEARKRVIGADHPDTLRSVSYLAFLYFKRQQYVEAETLFREVFEIQRRALGANHLETLSTMNALASVYDRQERCDEAETLFRETLAIQRRVLGQDDPHTLQTMVNLAISFGRQGRYDESETLFLETFEIQRRVLGEDHPKTLWGLYNLARVNAMRGNRAKAMDWLSQAVEAGFTFADHMNSDSPLEWLHGPEFDALVERARQNAAAQRTE